MISPLIFVFVLIFMSTPLTILSSEKHLSKYAGQETRSIKSLSEEDISDLLNGRGWGLAKSAELNGVPGPLHLLEMKTEIKLTTTQIAQIEEIYKDMKTRAVLLGTRLVEQERGLDQYFLKGNFSNENLKKRLTTIGKTRTDLRFVHLSSHFETVKIVTPQQLEEYNALRGYFDADDPCQNIPAGHNAEMWKKHNNCE